MTVRITIEQLVLRGVPRADADGVVAALVRHLSNPTPARTPVDLVGAEVAAEIRRAVR